MSMLSPMKRSGWQQGLHQISATPKELVGTIRWTRDGRAFRYSKADTSGLTHGKMAVAAAIAADVMNEACASAHAIGDKVITETITSATYAEDYFKGGCMHVNDGTGEGYSYPIESSTAVAAGTSITLTLEVGIVVALVATTSEFTLAHSPWMACGHSTTEESFPVGVPLVDITASYYGWVQTHGPVLCLSSDTSAVATMMTNDATAGAVAAISATLDVDMPYYAIQWGTAGVSGEYKPIFLLID